MNIYLYEYERKFFCGNDAFIEERYFPAHQYAKVKFSFSERRANVQKNVFFLHDAFCFCSCHTLLFCEILLAV